MGRQGTTVVLLGRHQGCPQWDMLGSEKPFPGYGLLSRMSKLQSGQGRGEGQQAANPAGAKSRHTNLPNADSSRLGARGQPSHQAQPLSLVGRLGTAIPTASATKTNPAVPPVPTAPNTSSLSVLRN